MKESIFFRDKKVLVAGASGFVGTNLSTKLLDLGAEVIGTHNKRPIENLPTSSQLKCDFTKYEDCLRATKGVDYVFMCAANTSGAAVMEKTH
jgi:Nucleoside-diphosphate-sugar epimerases